MVRHKTIDINESEEPELRIAEAAFFSRASAELHLIKTITELLDIRSMRIPDVRVELMDKYKNSLLSNKNQDYIRFNIPCNWDETGNKLEDDLIELEKIPVRP
jgi:hypothetical protein